MLRLQAGSSRAASGLVGGRNLATEMVRKLQITMLVLRCYMMCQFAYWDMSRYILWYDVICRHVFKYLGVYMLHQGPDAEAPAPSINNTMNSRPQQQQVFHIRSQSKMTYLIIVLLDNKPYIEVVWGPGLSYVGVITVWNIMGTNVVFRLINYQTTLI